MDIGTFKNTLAGNNPPAGLSDLQKGLWHAAKGNWDAAHDIAQQYEGTKNFDRLHAYLHRVEGDEWNAGYWYRRAGSVKPTKNTEEELEELLLASFGTG